MLCRAKGYKLKSFNVLLTISLEGYAKDLAKTSETDEQ